MGSSAATCSTPLAHGGRAALVAWPAEADRRDDLARTGAPCLLVVDDGAPIPAVGPGEDWIRRSASEDDVAARLAHLTTAHRPAPATPVNDASALLAPSLGDRSRPEQRLLARLAATPGRLVLRVDLRRVVDPAQPASDVDLARALAVARRALPAGWAILAVGGGLLLDQPEAGPT